VTILLYLQITGTRNIRIQSRSKAIRYLSLRITYSRFMHILLISEGNTLSLNSTRRLTQKLFCNFCYVICHGFSSIHRFNISGSSFTSFGSRFNFLFFCSFSYCYLLQSALFSIAASCNLIPVNVIPYSFCLSVHSNAGRSKSR
jgi:hypothetical protein